MLLKYLNSIKGNGVLAIGVVVYGNRNFDDALIELRYILELDGFTVIARAAFIANILFLKPWLKIDLMKRVWRQLGILLKKYTIKLSVKLL